MSPDGSIPAGELVRHDADRDFTSRASGLRTYTVRYCSECEARMYLIEDIEEQRSVCKFCRNGWERAQ